MRARKASARQARRRKQWRRRIDLQSVKRWLSPALIAISIALVGVGAWQGYHWLTLPTTLPIRSVTLAGELKYVDPGRLQLLLKDEVNAGFFSLDLMGIKQKIESLPWVYQASLRRIWPDKLQITVEEQRPIARWGDSGLINRYGDIFEVAVAPGELELPVIVGRRQRCKALIKSFNMADQLLYPLGLKLVSLTEDQRGDQRLQLNNGALLALGRKNRGERLQRFIASYRKTLAPFMDEIARLDLRYANGFAVKWKNDMIKTGAKSAKGPS